MSMIITFMPVNIAESAVLDGHSPVASLPGWSREEILSLAAKRTFGGDATTPEHTQPYNDAGRLINQFLMELAGAAEVNSREYSVPAYTLAAELSRFRIKRNTMEVRALIATNMSQLQQLAYFDRCVSDAVCAAVAGMYPDIRITLDIVGE